MELKTIMINKVKKGTKVTFRDGTTGIVADNKSGIIRNADAGEGPRSTYAFNWMEIELYGELYKCTMTPAQRDQSIKIMSAGFG